MKEGGTEEKGETEKAIYRGKPYFAVDISGEGWKEFREKVKTAGEKEGGGKGKGLDWRVTRVDMDLPAREAAMVGFARQVLHWNGNNKFCSACGGKTMSVHGGTKRVCPEKDQGKDVRPCPVRKGVHNIAVSSSQISSFSAR